MTDPLSQEPIAEFPPGDNSAKKAGCSCPREANQHGKGINTSGTYWLNTQCPYHAGSKALAIGGAPRIVMRKYTNFCN